VPNGSFEDFVNCPNSISQIELATGWYSANTGTPDFFNTCASDGLMANVPNAHFGYQNPMIGNGFAGIGLSYFNTGFENYREYIEVMLIEPLIANKNYKINFYVNKGNRCKYSTDKIGVLLSSMSMLTTDNFVVSNISNLKNVNISFIRDTINWTLIEANYNAVGGEQYLIIGNFEDDLGTNYILENYGIFNHSYIYIDEVYLSENNTNFVDEKGKDKFLFDSENNKIITNFEKINIYNSAGILIKSFKNTNSIILDFLSNGMYLIESFDENGLTFKYKIKI
jgi:OmpA-OmpF porin, OOP family